MYIGRACICACPGGRAEAGTWERKEKWRLRGPFEVSVSAGGIRRGNFEDTPGRSEKKLESRTSLQDEGIARDSSFFLGEMPSDRLVDDHDFHGPLPVFPPSSPHALLSSPVGSIQHGQVGYRPDNRHGFGLFVCFFSRSDRPRTAMMLQSKFGTRPCILSPPNLPLSLFSLNGHWTHHGRLSFSQRVAYKIPFALFAPGFTGGYLTTPRPHSFSQSATQRMSSVDGDSLSLAGLDAPGSLQLDNSLSPSPSSSLTAHCHSFCTAATCMRDYYRRGQKGPRSLPVVTPEEVRTGVHHHNLSPPHSPPSTGSHIPPQQRHLQASSANTASIFVPLFSHLEPTCRSILCRRYLISRLHSKIHPLRFLDRRHRR